MKIQLKHILISLPIVLLAACSNKNPDKGNFQLTGKLNSAHGEVIYLEQLAPDGTKPINADTLDADGQFSFSTTLTEVGFYRLKIAEKNFATFIFDANQKVSITGDARDLGATYQVEGSPDSKLFLELTKASTVNYRQRDSLQKAFQAFAGAHQGDSIRIDSMSKILEPPYLKLLQDHNQFLVNFISKNNTSLASLAAAQQLAIEDFVSTFTDLDKSLNAKYPNLGYVKAFHQEVKTKTACAIGSPAPEIKYNTPDGKPLALSSLKGKVVLVDFWASWCGPCRMENPNVVRAYNKYKDKGFDIYSVSLDNNLDKWKMAIQKDNLTWKSHVCDFKGWQSPVVSDYNFNGIPTNVLIDKKGNIIAKNLRGIDLENKLAEVFK